MLLSQREGGRICQFRSESLFSLPWSPFSPTSCFSLSPSFSLFLISFHFISIPKPKKGEKEKREKKRKKDFFNIIFLLISSFKKHWQMILSTEITRTIVQGFRFFFFLPLFPLFEIVLFSLLWLNCNEELIKLLEDIVHYLSFFDLHCI